MKDAYKAVFKPTKNVPVFGVTFEGKPYTVDINSKVPDKAINDPKATPQCKMQEPARNEFRRYCILSRPFSHENFPYKTRNVQLPGASKTVPRGCSSGASSGSPQVSEMVNFFPFSNIAEERIVWACSV